jgi:hypothetical protein
LGNANKIFPKPNFDWKEKVLTLCTDGAPAMLANRSFRYFIEKGSSTLRRHSLLFTQTCTGNKDSSNNPERSYVNSHKSSTLPEADL